MTEDLIPSKVFLDVDEFTRNVTTEKIDNVTTVLGDGIFDNVMETATKHLLAQYTDGRISGEHYAEAYVQVMIAVLNTSAQLITTLLQKDLLQAQIDLEKAKLPLIEAQIATEANKAALYERQTKGFDDDAKLRLLKVLYDPYGVAFSVAKDNPLLVPPSGISKDTLDSITHDLISKSNLGGEGGAIIISSNPLG